VVRRLGAGSGVYSEYDFYFTPGGQNYREVVISLPTDPWEEGGGTLAQPQHFVESAGGNQLVHYRAAEFPVLGVDGMPVGKSFHIGEIQSDWAQNRTARNREIAVANMSPEEATDYVRTYLDPKYEELLGLEEAILFDGGVSPEERRAYEELNSRIHKEYEMFTRYFDLQGTRTDTPTPDPLPENAVVKDTNEVTRLALRQALVDAVNTDADYVTLGTGEMAANMTGGKLSGQQEYYDRILPRQLKELFKRLGKEYEIEMPEIFETQIASTKGTHTVPGFVLTDELKDAIRFFGMSMFRDGGYVSGV